MKKIIQLGLFFFILVSLFVFYKTYFYKNEENQNLTKTSDNELIRKTENNFIKNLKYEIRLNKNNYYKITSKESEITYVNSVEIVKMYEVKAVFIDQNNLPLIITSKKAVYNNSNYNTNFREDVQIEYLDNKIFSDKMDLNFQNNIIKIFQNVRYVGAEGKLESDNIELNLITKEVNVYMDNGTDNVQIIQN
jgi:hypothetical protein